MTHTPSAAGHEYVTITEAVAKLGLSERSIRRGIASGRLASHVEAGRRVVAVPTEAGGRQDTGNPPDVLSVAASGTTSGGTELAAAFGVIVAEHRQAVRQARRASRIGWSAAVAGFVLAGSLAVWGVRAIEQAQGQAAAARAEAGIWRTVAEADRRRVDELVRHQAERVVVAEADHQADGWPGVPYPIQESVTIP